MKQKKLSVKFFIMRVCVVNFSLFFSFLLLNYSQGTIDINLFEFQYLADHLTGKECNRLVASLHFHTFELPEDLDAAERRLPDGVPCIDLLTHWNSTPREGKGESHVTVCHRLNQIGRGDLAKWLSRTVSHEISKDLTMALSADKQTDSGASVECNITEVPVPEVVVDEAAWWELDSLMEILIVFCLIVILFGSIFMLYLFFSARHSKSKYEKVNTQET